LKALFEQPAIRIPKRGEVRIDKPRYEKVGVALQYLDKPAVGIDAPPLPTGDKARRTELSFPDKRDEKSPGSGVIRGLLMWFKQSSDNRKEVRMQDGRKHSC